MSKPQILKGFFYVAGLIMIGNGIWMEGAAVHWFFNIPADLPATGDPNGHLIRDVGLIYIIFGASLIWCAPRLKQCRPVYVIIALFMVGHALGHIIEILLGSLPSSHWLIDLPVVLLPGLIFGLLAIPQVWQWATE